MLLVNAALRTALILSASSHCWRYIDAFRLKLTHARLFPSGHPSFTTPAVGFLPVAKGNAHLVFGQASSRSFVLALVGNGSVNRERFHSFGDSPLASVARAVEASNSRGQVALSPAPVQAMCRSFV